jgi:hypothetical protein
MSCKESFYALDRPSVLECIVWKVGVSAESMIGCSSLAEEVGRVRSNLLYRWFQGVTVIASLSIL